MNKKGIDVSQWQGTINWEKVKADGVEFAIIRAGYGFNTVDKQFVRNITECNRLEIPCGIYWFFYALTPDDAEKEAEFCINLVKPYRLEYPIFYDLEGDTFRYASANGVKLNQTIVSEMVRRFCGKVESAGYYAANYSNRNFLRNYFDKKVQTNYDLWYALYSTTCDRTDMKIWQHTSTGKVNGIAGNVDLDIAYCDYPAIIRDKGLNGFPKKPKKGDINSDGKINGIDVLMVKKNVIGNLELTDEQKEIADINGDGKVNSIDVLKMKKAVLGTYTIKPEGK